MTSTNTHSKHPTGPADQVPVDRDAAVVEAWFAEAGVTATVVARCPDPTCPACRVPLADAA